MSKEIRVGQKIGIFVLIIILTILPFIFLANSNLVVSEGGHTKSGGHEQYLVVSIALLFFGEVSFQLLLSNIIIGTFFGIGTFPLITFFKKGGSYIRKSLQWLLVSTLSFLIASIVGSILAIGLLMIGFTELIGIYIPIIIGIVVSCYFLINQYSRLLMSPFSDRRKYIFIVSGSIFSMIFFFIGGGIGGLGGWGTTPGINITTIILWHLTMSIILFILTVKK